MPPPDPTQAFLRSRKSPPDVVAGGLSGLIDRWRKTVAQIRQGYRLTFDDYLNDMDVRQLIEETLPHATVRQHKQATAALFELDEAAQSHLVRAGKCLWGRKAESEHGWTPERNWWYFMRPKSAPPEFLDEFNRPSSRA
ncbi:MAG TPA: hypothetical protein VEA69_07325 [Tepidisphaeraceae bacterium]|nr:hypothetical protein [Tepidisphaeraceae bacterium]